MSKLEKLVESRLDDMKARRMQLIENWSPYINAVEGYLEKKGKVLTEMDKSNIAQVCENSLCDIGLKGKSRLYETTYSSNIEFLGVSELCAA